MMKVISLVTVVDRHKFGRDAFFISIWSRDRWL